MNRLRILCIEMHKQRHNLAYTDLYFTLFPCSFILADRLKEERVREVIKLQTGATRREGGKEEGREEERFLERRSKQDMAKEQKKGKHRGGLSRAEVLSLQGLCIFQGQTDRNKTLAVHFLTYKTLERSRYYRAVTDINM